MRFEAYVTLLSTALPRYLKEAHGRFLQRPSQLISRNHGTIRRYITGAVLDEVPLNRTGATQPHFWTNI
jgi:hypothetical protein